MTSTDALIRDLSADLAPVQRRRLLNEAGALLVLAATELVLILVAGVMRPNMGRVLLSPFMVWKLGSLALLAIVSCTVAIRSFAPPTDPRRGVALVLGLVCLAAIAGVFVTSAAESGRSLIERLAPVHGVLCAIAIVVLGLPITASLGVLMRRAAPAHPEHSALAVGLAAFTCGALLFAVCCPHNDPLYVVVWYAVGGATLTALARWLLPRRFSL